MSAPELKPNADKTPNEVGTEESERRRESELAGQTRAIVRARPEPDPNGTTDAAREPTTGERSNADQAKKNEREAEEEGRELPS